ncbi:MAG: hypothetical protein ACFE7R_04655 [Candidatus Hodarchaeota archaeon]
MQDRPPKTDLLRFFGLVAAGALLNIGLYFLLYIVTPFVSGLVIGFFLRDIKKGIIGSYLAGIIALAPFFYWLDLVGGGSSDLAAILAAAALVSLIGFAGGAFGGVLSIRASTTRAV